jgi:hypothetical protein
MVLLLLLLHNTPTAGPDPWLREERVTASLKLLVGKGKLVQNKAHWEAGQGGVCLCYVSYPQGQACSWHVAADGIRLSQVKMSNHPARLETYVCGAL